MSTFEALQQSDTAVLRGDFVILYKHGHWHLVGTRRAGAKCRVDSVHVMSPERAKSTLLETPSAKPKTYDELGAGFETEIKDKILPHTNDYLPLFKSGQAGLSAGFHTDTMQKTAYSPEREAVMLRAVSEMISAGNPGVCIYFNHAL
ncbi:MAG: hypothetical protein NTZ11_00050 [Gammaproteobacteria bacterium]|nr:hypothetical protein [Gammaproteobacteria bacterium]